MDKRLRFAGVAAACIGALVGTALLTSRLQPNGSPFRPDVITLINDVGEKIVVLKATVKEALENSSNPRENTLVTAGTDWAHGQQAARIQ